MKAIALILSGLMASTIYAAAAEKSEAPKVHYQSGKQINFEELLIQGALKRPELSVVTGDTGQGGDGLVRLRENFLDKLTADAGEEIP